MCRPISGRSSLDSKVIGRRLADRRPPIVQFCVFLSESVRIVFNVIASVGRQIDVYRRIKIQNPIGRLYFLMLSQHKEYHIHVLYCCDYIKKIQLANGFLYFHRPINIILSEDWSDYIKDITRRLTKSVPKLYNRPNSADGRPTHRPMISGERRSADTSADDMWLIQI